MNPSRRWVRAYLTSSLGFLGTQGDLHHGASGSPDLSVCVPLHLHCRYAAHMQLWPTAYQNQWNQVSGNARQINRVFEIPLDEMDGLASAWEYDSPRVNALLLPTEFILLTVNLQFYAFIQTKNPATLQTQEASSRQDSSVSSSAHWSLSGVSQALKGCWVAGCPYLSEADAGSTESARNLVCCFPEIIRGFIHPRRQANNSH